MNYIIEGPLHSIKVKFVTKRTLRKIWGKSEDVYGMYDSNKNQIYIAKDQTDEQKLQTLFHEIYHAITDQTVNMEDESKADVIGAWLIKFFQISSIEEVLS